jgi:non-canonical (house-cleaning) NTP pyrophosphatase
MKVAVGSNNPLKEQAVQNTFSKVFRGVKVVTQSVDSGVSSQPKGDAVVTGAPPASRARSCICFKRGLWRGY